MKICIVGAGAIGGFLGIRLANAGHQVSLLARGKHLQAIRSNGVKLIESDREIKVNVVWLPRLCVYNRKNSFPE